MPKHTDINSTYVDNLATMSRAKNFLGREFLAWVWWTAETTPEITFNSRTINKKNIKTTIWVDDRIILDAASGQSHTQILKGGDPSRSPEASFGLRAGKEVKELRLGVRIEPLGEYRCTLERTDLAPKGLIMPTSEDMKGLDPESFAEARLRQVELFQEFLDELFRRFLDCRIATTWENDTLNQMRDWVGRRAGSKQDKVVH